MRQLLKKAPVSERLDEESIQRRWYILGVGLIIIGIPLHQALFIVLGLLLTLILLTTDIWARYCFHSLQYQRRLSERRVSFGEEVVLSIGLENAKLLPLPWLEVRDEVPRTLPIQGLDEPVMGLKSERRLLECLFSVGWYQRVTRRFAMQCRTRGVHTFGPTQLFCGDVFGFTKRKMQVAERQYLLVYPLVVPLSSFGLPARHPFGERVAPRRLLEDPLRIVGVREYAYGDSMRRVNWKATARTLQLQSNVYEATTTYTITLFLNVSSTLDMHYGYRPDLQELEICAAASVSTWALEQGYAVGLYANTYMSLPDEQAGLAKGGKSLESRLRVQLAHRRIYLPPASNVEQLPRIMETLARIQPYFGIRIEDMLQAEASRLSAGSTVVVITSELGERLMEVLLRLRRGGHPTAVLFAGDTPPPSRFGGIPTYYLGGDEAWTRLVARYGQGVQSASNAGGGFRL